MKKYFLGGIELKNIDILKNELSKVKDFDFVGVQRSLSHFNETKGGVCCIEEELYYYRLPKEVDNEKIWEDCEFELPLITKFQEYVGYAVISGTGVQVLDEDEDVVDDYFIIEKVKIKVGI